MSHPSKHWHALFSGAVPKDSAFPESNEDKLRISDENQLYILSDGASESFNSALWADVLVESASTSLPHSRFTRWLKQAIATYEERSDLAGMSWSQAAAFARGSFASLLVVELQSESISLTAIGDTVALMVEHGTISRAFPYTASAEFQQRPHLLSTLRSRHSTPFFQQALRSLKAKKSSVANTGCKTCWPYPGSTDSFLICVTDALGEWLLRHDDKAQGRVHAVLGVKNQEDLTRLIEEARRDDGMRRDDSTLIIIGDGYDTTNS